MRRETGPCRGAETRSLADDERLHGGAESRQHAAEFSPGGYGRGCAERSHIGLGEDPSQARRDDSSLRRDVVPLRIGVASPRSERVRSRGRTGSQASGAERSRRATMHGEGAEGSLADRCDLAAHPTVLIAGQSDAPSDRADLVATSELTEQRAALVSLGQCIPCAAPRNRSAARSKSIATRRELLPEPTSCALSRIFTRDKPIVGDGTFGRHCFCGVEAPVATPLYQQCANAARLMAV